MFTTFLWHKSVIAAPHHCPQPLGDGATLTDGPKPEKYDCPAGCIYIHTTARAIVAVLFTAARGQSWATVGNVRKCGIIHTSKVAKGMKIVTSFLFAFLWSAFIFADTIAGLWLIRFIFCMVLCGVPVQFFQTWCVWVSGVCAAVDFVCVFLGKICGED